MDLSTTVVNSESGQSLLEFAFLLPVLVGMTVVLIRINTAIQISIVNQQYSRAQVLFAAFNSPFYPEAKYQADMVEKKMNQVVMGVSENTNQGGEDDYTPLASIQRITRSKTIRGPNAPQSEPRERALVRVRNTVTLCAPNYFLTGQNLPTRKIDWGGGRVLAHNLLNSTRFDFCGSPLVYE